MVCLAGERGKLSGKSSMAVAPERTKPLHNFDMPWLRWGSQKYLRCMKVNSDSGAGDETRRRSQGFGSEFRPIASDRMRRRKKSLRVGDSEEEEGGGDGIAAVREKLLGDLKVAAAKMKDAIFRAGEDESDGVAALTAAAAKAAEEEESEIEARPWNLRTRRAACKAPVASSPEKTTEAEKKKKKREKFSLGLSKKEIESDFMELLGHKPARRPKKRPRHVQRQLDFLLPGFFLTEITAETYKVSENPETKR